MDWQAVGAEGHGPERAKDGLRPLHQSWTTE